MAWDEEFHALAKEWRRTMPSRAEGGRRALTGFHYQFLVTLVAAVESFLKSPSSNNSPKVIMETLSDYVKKDSNAIVVVQVKRRLDSVKDALNQLWSIYELAGKVAPRSKSVLKFQIQTSSTKLKNASKHVALWMPTNDPMQEVSVFKQRVEVSILSDPEAKLYSLLHDNFRAENPSGLVKEFLGQLLAAAEEAAGYERVAEQIWSKLSGLHNTKEFRPNSGIYLWRPDDIPPSEAQRGEYLTGQPPMVRHLREGFFAERKNLLDATADALLEWIENEPFSHGADVQLPVYWLSGRSGCGKSVLLLQLLARVSSGGIASVLWLGNKIQLLPEAVAMSRNLVSDDRAVIIGVDDPYQVEVGDSGAAHWRLALSRLEDIRQAGKGGDLPIIVCCGPTEQADRFKDDFLAEANVKLIDIDKLTTPGIAESEADYTRLAEWFQSRTGTAPTTQVNENPLLVQVLFEWGRGDLGQFAKRFQVRLKSMDKSGGLLDFAQTLLALNRLYVGYPTSVVDNILNPSQRDDFELYLDKQHLVTRGGGRGGLWLAHPRLADIIYYHWFPPERRHTRSKHLTDVIQHCFKFGKSPEERNAPLWALSRAISNPEGELASRTCREDVEALLRKAYAANFSDPTQIATSDLPVWIQLASMLTSPAWVPDPISLALFRIREEVSDVNGQRLLCHTLVLAAKRNKKRYPEIVAVIAERLLKHVDWQEWSAVALDAIVSLKDVKFAPAIIAWLGARTVDLDSGRILDFAFKSLPPIGTLEDIASKLLPDAPISTRWGDVAIFLLQQDWPLHLPRCLTWLHRGANATDSVFLFYHLLGEQERLGITRVEVVSLAVEWASKFHKHHNANYVLERLLEMNPTHPEIQRWCQSWLPVGIGDKSYLLESLVRATHTPSDTEPERREELYATALTWLITNPDHLAWHRVFEPLWETEPERREGLCATALTWLTTHPNHPGLGHVLPLVWEKADPERRKGLCTIALSWLTTNFDRGGWSYVFELVWEADTDPERRKGLRAIALSLLATNPDHGAWGHVFKLVWEADADPERRKRLRATALSWLTAKLDHGGWCYVFELVWEADADPERRKGLRAIAPSWLAINPDHDAESRISALIRET